uniref:Skp1-related protein n=1 Tax=Ascaris suum TaxID=6253 RepID=F1LBM4_ASCSU
MIRLKSSDNEIFEVDRDVIKMSTTIYTMLQGPEMDFGDSNEQERTSELIPVDGVESSILRKVLEWCEHHKGDPVASQETDNVSEGIEDSWDVEFLNVDKEILFKTILAANELGIEGLLNATCKVMATMIKGKSPEEIERILTLEDQFTPEQEEQIRKEQPWPCG